MSNSLQKLNCVFEANTLGEIDGIKLLLGFFHVATEDPRLRTCHISLFTALLAECLSSGAPNPFIFSRQSIMNIAKVSSRQTYNKSMRDLASFGYIKYMPSVNGHCNSFVYFLLGKSGFRN